MITAIAMANVFNHCNHKLTTVIMGLLRFATAPYFTTQPRVRTDLPPDVLAQHTERPSLETMPSHQVVRLYLLHQALQNPDFLGVLGKSMSDDITTTSREFGGTMRYNNGRIELVDKPGVDGDDGIWAPRDISFYLSAGSTPLMWFHQHALSVDNTRYASPSGLELPTAGDMGTTRRTGLTGALFTSLGHPKDGAGNADELRLDELRLNVNVDMYYTDKNGKPVVFDLGTVTVPYTRSLPRQSAPAAPPRPSSKPSAPTPPARLSTH